MQNNEQLDIPVKLEIPEEIDNDNQVNNLVKPQNNDVNILMVGLDEAGKTALLYKLKLGKDGETIPTIGYNVETIEFENINFTIWDIGGLKTVRCLWNFYTENKNAVIFVVDATKPERLEEAKQHLHTVMSKDDLRDAVLLVAANKQDKAEECSNIANLEECLDLKSLKQHWRVCKTSAIGNWSLNDVLLNLSEMLKKT